MSQGQEVAKLSGGEEAQKEEPDLCSKEPGYCSGYCINKECVEQRIKNPLPKTSDIYATCNLPKRFEHPHWFNGYGSQVNKEHPFYRTTASQYGWYPPGLHSVPTEYYPARQRFTNQLASFGMYRNYSLNTARDPTND